MIQDIQAYAKELSAIFTQQNLQAFMKRIEPDIQNLQNFRFYLSNPVFLTLILAVFLILSRVWGFKRSFHYCLLVSSVLCLTTITISRTSMPIDGSGITYADIIKFLALTAISLITIYYFLMKAE